MDTPWDQFKKSRDTFTHVPLSHQRILCNHVMNPPPLAYNIGAHWTHYTLDPNETHPIVDSLTKSTPPWCAYCPDHDTELLHFPAAVLNVHVNRDLFLSSFNQPWDTKNQADFLKHFPPLPLKATI